ncbi:hypothetical protein APUTEX25_004320, partial [Auxenochlorella protothecoides]
VLRGALTTPGLRRLHCLRGLPERCAATAAAVDACLVADAVALTTLRDLESVTAHAVARFREVRGPVAAPTGQRDGARTGPAAGPPARTLDECLAEAEADPRLAAPPAPALHSLAAGLVRAGRVAEAVRAQGEAACVSLGAVLRHATAGCLSAALAGSAGESSPPPAAHDSSEEDVAAPAIPAALCSSPTFPAFLDAALLAIGVVLRHAGARAAAMRSAVAAAGADDAALGALGAAQ